MATDEIGAEEVAQMVGPVGHHATSRTAYYTQRLLEEIPWEWVPVEDIFAKVFDTVPPGKALKKYKMEAENNRLKAEREKEARIARGEEFKAQPPRPPLTEVEQIISGKRNLLNQSLGSLRSNGHIETRTEGGHKGTRYVRRRERRERCNCQTAKDAPAPDPVATVEKERESLATLLAEHEAEFGVISEEEMAEVQAEMEEHDQPVPSVAEMWKERIAADATEPEKPEVKVVLVVHNGYQVEDEAGNFYRPRLGKMRGRAFRYYPLTPIEEALRKAGVEPIPNFDPGPMWPEDEFG